MMQIFLKSYLHRTDSLINRTKTVKSFVFILANDTNLTNPRQFRTFSFLTDYLKRSSSFRSFRSSISLFNFSNQNISKYAHNHFSSEKRYQKDYQIIRLKNDDHQIKHVPQSPSSFCLNENFKTTEISSISYTPQFKLKIPNLNKKSSKKTELKKILESIDEDQLDKMPNENSLGRAKWHLKNVFYLLKNNYEDDEDESKKNRNITLFHPTKQTFESSSRRKQEAEDNTSYNALLWLKEQGVINVDNKPIALEKQKLKKYIDSKKGILESLDVKKFNSAQRKYLEDFIDLFELKHKPMLENEIDLYLSNEINRQTLHYEDDNQQFRDFHSETPEDFNSKHYNLFSMISGRPLKKMNNRDRDRVNSQLANFLKRRDESNDHDFDQYIDYKRKLANLPIHKYREELLDLIFDNQVVVVSGETGCGKSTQIPQYILEDMIRGGCGADCSIIVTQPRRLPAISVSEQSALQFGEKSIGNSFGYQVRFEKELPIRDNGVVLFCTTGMLLRKMAGNPYLIGISHLIIDEVHEREFLADLTVILLKKILEKNDRIKVILMSASLNAEVFSKYFKNCPVYNIPGRCYPVERIYLDQIERELRRPIQKTNKTSNDRRVDYNLVTDLIHYINNTKPNNDSILCFLPGWHDIKKVGEDLDKTKYLQKPNSPSLSIIPVHSKLTSEDQKAIFKPLQNGVRKVILSTNITETSLTVPDVVYVIDPGLCNETYYNKEYNVSTFGTHLISQANAKQRQGRAGRVKPGICYKLYTEDTEQNQMLKYFLAEILRIPLETAVVLSKLYCPDEKVDDFLSNALEPPSKSAILHAVNTLKLINVLDQDEHLTLLGRKIVDLSLHPRLSVCLLTSAMTGCFNQVLSLSAMLSQPKDPFLMMMGNRGLVKSIKETLSSNNLSDYFALYNLLQMHENIKNEIDDPEAQTFFAQYQEYINFGTLESARHLKKLFTRDLADNGIENDNELIGPDLLKSNCFFDLSLLSGLYPNVLKYVNEKNSQKFQLIDVNTGHQTNYSSESMLSSVRIENETYFTAIYFDSFYSEDRRKLMIKNASLLPSVYVLFACKNLKIVKEEGQMITFILDDCKYLIFTMDKQDLKLILKWKDIFNIYQQWYLCNDKNSASDSSNYIYLKKTFKEFLDLTNKVFDRYGKTDLNVKESIGQY